MKFIKSVFQEMKKVTWPSRKQLYRDTKIVFGTSIIFAIILFIFDTSIKTVIQAILSLG
ncbi:MAG: preprotein translocase subunit SecE [Streptococcaceae bacterium]|nr:preprotein translocase subunit SecE [Streptococcaceae bacterium]